MMAYEQMTIFDFIFEPDLYDMAIKNMEPYWTNSRRKIVEAYKSGIGGRNFANVVKHEYCPYGGVGHYGGVFGKKGVFTLTGWEMRDHGITFRYDPYMVEEITWNNFAKRVARLIRKGEFKA